MSNRFSAEDIVISNGTSDDPGSSSGSNSSASSAAFSHWARLGTTTCLCVDDDWSLETSGSVMWCYQFLTSAEAHLMKQEIIELVRE